AELQGALTGVQNEKARLEFQLQQRSDGTRPLPSQPSTANSVSTSSIAPLKPSTPRPAQPAPKEEKMASTSALSDIRKRFEERATVPSSPKPKEKKEDSNQGKVGGIAQQFAAGGGSSLSSEPTLSGEKPEASLSSQPAVVRQKLEEK